MQQPVSRPAGTWPSWINLLAGIWVFLSPWIWGFSAVRTPLWNNVIFGALVAITAIVVIRGARAASWWNALFGIWLIISPFVLRYGMMGRAAWNDVVLGIIITIVALIPTRSSPRIVTTT